MSTKSLLLIALFSVSAFAGDRVTVLTSKTEDSEFKSVVSTDEYRDDTRRVLLAWTAAYSGGDFAVNFDKIDAQDEAYARQFSDYVVDHPDMIIPVLVDKKTGKALAYPDVDYMCAYTGVDGANPYCNHYGAIVVEDQKNGVVTTSIYGKWNMRWSSVMLVQDQGDDGLQNVAASANLVDLMFNSAIRKLDVELVNNQEYLDSRESLVINGAEEGNEIVRTGNVIKVKMPIEVSRPKYDFSYATVLNFTLSAPSGQGLLVYRD